MKIINETNNENLRQALALVLKHYKDDAFLKAIKEIDSFNHTEDVGIIVAHKIQTFNKTITIKMYRPWYRWTKANAYAKDGVIYFNQYKNFPVIDRCETLIHEVTHLLGYKHRTNYVTKYNLLTVPYRVSNLFSGYVRSIYQGKAA